MPSHAAIIVLFALGALAAGCKSEARARHEKLARDLDAPVKVLCEWNANREAGGCMRECHLRVAARAGRAVLASSRELAALEPNEDPRTELLLEPIRRHSRELRAALEAPCAERVSDDTPVTPALERCAEASTRTAATTRALIDGLDALAKSAERSTGAHLPSLAASCR